MTLVNLKNLPKRSAIYAFAATASLVAASPVSAGIAKNSTVPAGAALLIGGDTPRGIEVDGQNRSSVAVDVLIERDGERRYVKTLAPRQRFTQYIRSDEAIILRNASAETRATVYWHVSGYSKLVNPRVE